MTTYTSVIRKATLEDTALILSFIKKMAEYEKQLDRVTCEEEDIEKHFFSDRPIAYAAFILDDNREVGFALYYLQFDSLRGQPSMFLHDLFIEEPYRRKGFGHKLMKFLRSEALQFGCEKISWQCFKWNFLAQNFYSKLNAEENTKARSFELCI